jgi:GNAT superfamily N-acetyltransferase
MGHPPSPLPNEVKGTIESLKTPAHLIFMHHPQASLTEIQLLDNPIWSALTTEQAYLAQGNTLARRFPRDVAPFAAMSDHSPAAFQALADILAGDPAPLSLDASSVLPDGWAVLFNLEAYQMVFDGPTPPKPKHAIRKLTHEDVPEMLALTKLTEPGPFLPRTIELGTYLGIHDAGSLVAMAGERLHLTGFTEVSAVCTHPDFTGRGYGAALVSAVMAGILDRGETPFLHMKAGNPAIGLYQKLGFKVRAPMHLAAIKYVPA